MNGLSLTVLGITTTGSLKGTKLMSNLSLSGAVDIQQFDPQTVLGALKVKVETADSKVLHSASAKANFLYNSKQTALNDLQLKLDDSTLAGRVGLEGEKLTYALAVDDINVDRYLPPGPPRAKPTRRRTKARSTRSTCRSTFCARSTRTARSSSARRSSAA